MYRPVAEGWLPPDAPHSLTLDEFDRIVRVKLEIQAAEKRAHDKAVARAKAERE